MNQTQTLLPINSNGSGAYPGGGPAGPSSAVQHYGGGATDGSLATTNGGANHHQPQQQQQQQQQEGEVEEEAPLPEIDITINNVVCSFSVRCHLNLRDIALRGINVEYRKENGVSNMYFFILLVLLALALEM